jgi:hypothetical protein
LAWLLAVRQSARVVGWPVLLKVKSSGAAMCSDGRIAA